MWIQSKLQVSKGLIVHYFCLNVKFCQYPLFYLLSRITFLKFKTRKLTGGKCYCLPNVSDFRKIANVRQTFKARVKLVKIIKD